MEGTPTAPEPRAAAWVEAVLATAVALFGTLLGLGAVMAWVGPGALLTPGPAATALTSAFVLVGGAGLVVLFGAFPRRTSAALRSTVPHMFPFGSVPLDVALYLLVFAVVTCSTHAFFDVFTGADNGGQVDGLANQNALDLILLGASIVVYLSTMFAVLLIARVVRMGRRLDAERPDPYRQGPPEPSEEPDWRPSTAPAAPASRYAGPVLYAVSLIVGLGMSAATQLLEVSLQPASPMQWVAGQAFTPVWALVTAWALRYLDRGTRTLERRYYAAVGAATAASAPRGEPVT